MALRHVWIAVIGVIALGWCSLSHAQDYRPDEYLRLDLSKAVLSPKVLGPAEHFRPGPLHVTIDRGSANAENADKPKSMAAVPASESKSANRTALGTATSGIPAVHARAERSTAHKSRALVNLHRHNPVEAEARDSRIQVWPCKSGGICNWKK